MSMQLTPGVNIKIAQIVPEISLEHFRMASMICAAVSLERGEMLLIQEHLPSAWT